MTSFLHPLKNAEQIIDDMKDFTRCSMYIDVEDLIGLNKIQKVKMLVRNR